MATEEFLSQLASSVNAVHRAPVNRYQHFINASVYLNSGMKRADAVRNAQVDWKQRASLSDEEYCATMEQAKVKLNKLKTKPIESFFRVQVINLMFWHLYMQYKWHLLAISIS